MKESQKSKIVGINVVLLSVLFGLVSLNKSVLRPRLDEGPIAGIIVDCLPNFLAALIISLFIVTTVLVRRLENGRMFVYAGSLAVFLVLAVEEFKPMLGASEQFDPWDIAASGIGSLLAALIFELLEKRTKVSPDPDTSNR